ncbi:hypothetical protein [Helicobacter pylori]|uniref:Uncharacterized protein n=1 Tax=Helicobacter pylori Aklavik86 TaxID=1055532 RepID=K7Y811_HELPX|nr:hypothetical protein [Helicobacter pylori]AFX89776.1 hypothetical protein HPAKL86_03840 [Helicobacter pylori Aklavik86]WQS07436.1 hypothetical protein KVE43_03725 [Helicobacter pylori]WQS13715.1 hypothetical protein KVD76_03905 [Helicobacter pylori]WQS23456.1 hypothetical protein KVD61_03920 [Helicobacter pylori]WQS28216.1 hypothetical protein KVE05_04455 [Helicobacter pylori]
MQKFFSRFRRWALPFYFVSALAAIDIDELTEAQANSVKLSDALVSLSDKLLEKAVDGGRNADYLKELNDLHEKIKHLRLILEPKPKEKKNNPDLKDHQGSETIEIGEAIKKALGDPVFPQDALDAALQIDKQLDSFKQNNLIDPKPLKDILAQLETELRKAISLQQQWLNSQKPN